MSRIITQEIRYLCAKAADPFGVTATIHPEDQIFWFLIELPRQTIEEAIHSYFSTGAESATKLRHLVEGRLAIESPSVLEFASGYGCVTRHLARVFPAAIVTPCDIHDSALAFLKSEFGLEAHLSSNEPEKLGIEQTFDVVFALSFFSHMPARTFGRWLAALSARIRPGGLLIFTTNGPSGVRLMNVKLDETGFWFSRRSDQKDLDLEDYGTTISLFDYVYRRIQDVPGVRLIAFEEAFWWKHQDVYILRKQS